MSAKPINLDDVEILERKTVCQSYFRIDRYMLRHRLFRGGWSERNAVRNTAGVEPTFGPFPRDRLNPNGGSTALGHPFGATGARILSQAIKELSAMGKGKRAIVSICEGGQGSMVLLEAG